MAASFIAQTASVSFVDAGGNNHVHVYSSDGNNVTERVWDGNGWNTGSFSQPGDQLSATAWYVGGQYFIRVYCTVEGSTVEWCSDAGGTWYQGQYTTN